MPVSTIGGGRRSAAAPVASGGTPARPDAAGLDGSLYPSPRLPGDIANTSTTDPAEALAPAAIQTAEPVIDANAPILDSTTLQRSLDTG